MEKLLTCKLLIMDQIVIYKENQVDLLLMQVIQFVNILQEAPHVDGVINSLLNVKKLHHLSTKGNCH